MKDENLSDEKIKSIQNLIDSGRGDIGRLNYILNTLRSGKQLFSSDQNYLDNLLSSESVPKQGKTQEIKEPKDDSTEKLKEEVKHLHEKIEKMHEEQNVTQIIKNKGKSESTTLILSLVLGLIGLQGVGHMYVGRVEKGVGILILAIILGVVGILTLYFGFGLLLLIAYFIMFIWQIFDARKLCREYNLYLYKLNSSKYSKQNLEKIHKKEWSVEKIILVAAIISFGILPSAVMLFSINGGAFWLPSQSTVGDGYGESLFDQAIAYDKWKECAQKASSPSVCGSPPKSSFDYFPVDCSNGKNYFRCNPFYSETHIAP